MAKHNLFRMILAAIGCAAWSLGSIARAGQLPVVTKWERLELTFRSRQVYTNALQEAEMRVLFVSPLGETNRIYGFWDGGRTWRVRFAPNFAGHWRYYTMCSDTTNKGLHDQTGEFMCTAATASSRFGEHGPIQVARDHEHFEHADHTPFLWLGDAAWNAATQAGVSDWESYVKTRAAQKFNVVQWKLPAANADENSGAFTGRECITLNPDFFRLLDTKVNALARAGLLCAIAPLWEISTTAAETLPEDQAIALMRYVVARWGGDPVAWIVAFESDSTGAQAARWQRIGRAVFNPVSHGPVIVLPGEATWVLQAFRLETWVDALGFQTPQVTDEDALPWLLRGPLSLERNKVPARPLITLAPAFEGAPSTEPGKEMTSEFTRRFLWWSLLINTPAGVSYSARDVAEWVSNQGRAPESAWKRALSLSGAEAVAPIAFLFNSIEFWRLRPFPKAVIVRSGVNSPRDEVAVNVIENGNMVLLYLPDERVVRLLPGPLPAAAKSTWFNPRTGETRPAGAGVVSSTGLTFTTPSAGDWVLMVEPQR